MEKAKNYRGVYFRASEGGRLCGKKPDISFYIRYKSEGRQYLEKCGWSSEGYSAKAASEIRGERLRSIRHGEELPKEKAKVPYFDEAAKMFIEWGEENKKDPNDRARYENHLEHILARKRLNEISPFDLERIKADLFKKGLSPATVRHVLQFVRVVFNKMSLWSKYSGSNPVKKVSMPTLNNARQRFLSFDEAQTLLEELKKGSRTTYETALVSLHTGLRAGEIFKLKKQDIDLQNGIIRIADPKNKSPRAAFMTDKVKEILKARMPAEPQDLVFLPRLHAKSQIARVSGYFQRTADALFNKGVTDRRQRLVFHSLRHTFASHLAIQGTPLHVIKELMGHKTLTMTERYSHLSPDVKKEATRALGASFEASRNGKTVVPLAMGREQETRND